MKWLIRLLRGILLGAAEFLFAIIKILALVIALLLTLLAWLWMLILAMLRGKNLFPEEKDETCGQLPEAIVRRPDPAIYSQRLLMSQGLPVTWNNPDIWIAPAANPAAIEPDSYHLQDDTDYVVTVRAHNAGTDPAIGVRVRLRYRPWSFNSPDELPVEIDAAGNEVVRFVNIPPLGSALATFAWHTPAVPPGSESRHFCLQASLYHPMDTNTANNMGQENTNVWQSPNPGLPGPGDTLQVDVPLHNFSRRQRRFVFRADTYAIDADDRVELRLKTTLGHAKRSPAEWAASLVPTLHLGRQIGAPWTRPRQHETPLRRSLDRPVSPTSRPRFVAAKNRFTGFEQLHARILQGDYSLPAGMEIAADGAPLDEGAEIGPGADGVVPFTVTVPAGAQPGDRYPVNLIAMTENGVLAGGVTVFVQVREN
ncbi:MAG: hypothetical protein ACRDGV_09605 [Candidatus Limnocylindria bacterium]